MTKEKEYTPTISDLIPGIRALADQFVDFNERLAKHEKTQADDLRDRMAIAALTGIVAGSKGVSPEHINIVAETAYRMADAMLRARNK